MKLKFTSFIVFAFLLVPISFANAIDIDLNDFGFFPGDPVTIAPDGSSATILEDKIFLFHPIILQNDPSVGDPNVIIPGPNILVFFDYVFIEGTVGTEDDQFGAFVIDTATGLSAGPAYEFFIEDTEFGTTFFDLSGLVGKTLGLQFQLDALASDMATDSSVVISNVRLVPEPATMILLGSGVFGLAGFTRVRRKRKHG